MTGDGGREVIADDDGLLRRIPDQPERMWTRRSGRLRPSSAALKPASSDGGLSVDVRRLLPDPADPAAALGNRTDDGLIEFRAAVPRSSGLDVTHTPLPERYSHADVIGWAQLGKAAAKRIQRELALRAAWVKHPASADAESS